MSCWEWLKIISYGCLYKLILLTRRITTFHNTAASFSVNSLRSAGRLTRQRRKSGQRLWPCSCILWMLGSLLPPPSPRFQNSWRERRHGASRKKAWKRAFYVDFAIPSEVFRPFAPVFGKARPPFRLIVRSTGSKSVIFSIAFLHHASKHSFFEICIPYGTFGHFCPLQGVTFWPQKWGLF